MAKRTWFPSPTQVFVVERKNTSYLHSLWVGITTPIFNLPSLVWEEILAPVIKGVFIILLATVVSMFAGLCGVAAGIEDNEGRA